MTEKEYVRVMNLAHIRTAKVMLQLLIPDETMTRKDIDEFLKWVACVEIDLSASLTKR